MENLEPINAIVDEFQFKKRSLDLFGLSELYNQGINYEFTVFDPKDYSDQPPIIVFEDEEPSFCSIFSEQDFQQTQTSQFTSDTRIIQFSGRDYKELSALKLLSDREILSSDFEEDQSPPILLSERN